MTIDAENIIPPFVLSSHNRCCPLLKYKGGRVLIGHKCDLFSIIFATFFYLCIFNVYLFAKGMRIAMNSSEFESALESAKRESRNAFADENMLVEKYVERPRYFCLNSYSTAE